VNKGDWAYYCEGCIFVAHMSCSNPEVRPLYTDLLSENPIYSIVREESNRNESEMDIEASSSKTQDIGRGNFEQMPIDLERGRARKIERGSEKSNMAEFRLFNHQLPFLLFYEEMDIHVFCRACQVPVGGLTYTRTSRDIFLHKTCVDFPQEIQDPLHNCEDYLILMAQEHSYKCMACDLNCFAISFHCNSCKFDTFHVLRFVVSTKVKVLTPKTTSMTVMNIFWVLYTAQEERVWQQYSCGCFSNNFSCQNTCQ